MRDIDKHLSRVIFYLNGAKYIFWCLDKTDNLCYKALFTRGANRCYDSKENGKCFGRL